MKHDIGDIVVLEIIMERKDFWKLRDYGKLSMHFLYEEIKVKLRDNYIYFKKGID